MSERTDGDRIEPTELHVPAPGKPVGQRIDELVERIPQLWDEVTDAASKQARADRVYRTAHDQLVEMVGRPAAAKLLGITPRQLAGRMRGSK